MISRDKLFISDIMLFDFKNAKNGRLFAILTLKHVNADREY